MIQAASTARAGAPPTPSTPHRRETATDHDYDQIEHLLAASALAPTPSEAQGILCGLICGGAPDPERAWLDQLFPDARLQQVPAAASAQVSEPGAEPTAACAASPPAGLHDLARQTLDEIQGPGIGLTLLLPGDSRPLAERATALYDWVRGFLFALGVLGVSERDLSEQGREVLRDFTHLTRMDLDALPGGESADEADEAALAELTEFVWVAALLVDEERRGAHRESR